MPPTDPRRVAKDVGRRVAELRTAIGLTQQDLAERAAVSLKYVQRVEAGRENLTIRSLVWLADLLEAKVAELFAAPASSQIRRGRPKAGSGLDAQTTAATRRRRSTGHGPPARRGAPA
ncbi:MAG: helix-turn-helix transcriptional regulator [Deltaproteobacteria bacterium]|nr:helix-turn-helix transcriptional regulator [Deltaproteobacteria bacterium]